MTLCNGSFLLFQPRYRTPCVFDLHERGLFKIRPSLTQDWGARWLVDHELQVKVQVMQLIENSTADPRTGGFYAYRTRESLIELDQDLDLDPEALANQVPDERIRLQVLSSHGEWRRGYVPLSPDGSVDRDALRKKLTASLEDQKEIQRKELVRKNSHWVEAAMPRLLLDFQRGLYRRVQDSLYRRYRDNGGEDSESGLNRKIMLFFRVFENDAGNDLSKPDGKLWCNEDEMWECWVGFAGIEEEAKRVCRTMDAVFRPLREGM